jgi:hypothetical protein
MRRVALALVLLAHVAYAKGDKKKEKDDSGDEDVETSDDSGDDEGKPKENDKPKPKQGGDTTTPAEPVKQDLTGHDLGTRKRVTDAEKDRFFVDKVDTEKTEDSTLVQGSITSSSFYYHESGGAVTGSPMGSPVPSASPFDRYFTDLRLQTDFRHIAGSRWEGRFDGRIRAVDTPTQTTTPPAAGATWTSPQTPTAIQSGLNGKNEYEIRELWLIRNGERTDVILGRQFIPDLGGIKIDGLRIDYASSPQFTFLGFGGLYPLRGSRSLTTDYAKLETKPGLDPAGPFVGTGGFGAAYRTPSAYGAIGGVALIPLKGEEPRVYATSNGYLRLGPTLDIYHFALVDLIANSGAQITNFSAGVNYKPVQQLRVTASYNHVDTETLNVQANGFLQQPDPGLTNVVQNEVYVQRLSTDEVRGSVSAGLGSLQRFEITTAVAYRLRPEFVLHDVNGAMVADLPAAKSVEVFGGITDRRSLADARIGVDAVQTFSAGNVPFQRSKFFAARVFAAHDIKDGQGEWEAEVAYSTSVDTAGAGCVMSGVVTDLSTCFGYTNGNVISVGGTVYYRLNRDWLGIVNAYITDTSLKEAGMASDPAVVGLSGYLRIAYRF